MDYLAETISKENKHDLPPVKVPEAPRFGMTARARQVL
jgi:hypothetical protein